jgi:hypothetical protein
VKSIKYVQLRLPHSEKYLLLNFCRHSLRVLLPGLRLFTLNANEAARLPKFLMGEEDAELLRFFITKELGTDLPEKLNTCLEKRHQVKDNEQVLFSSSDYDLASNANTWYRGYGIENEIFITTNFDIYISKFTFAHGFVEKDYNDTSLMLKMKREKSVNIEIGLQHPYSTTADVATTLSATNWSTYEMTCSEPILLQKGVPMRLVLSTANCHLFCVCVPWSILDLTSSGDPAHKYFQQLQFKQTNYPIFLQSFSHRLA